MIDKAEICGPVGMLLHILIETVVALVVTVIVCRLLSREAHIDIREVLIGGILSGIVVVVIFCFVLSR